jgi:hypothetical protein
MFANASPFASQRDKRRMLLDRNSGMSTTERLAGFVDGQGVINAGSKRELAQRITQLIEASSTGEIRAREVDVDQKAETDRLITAAFRDRDGEAMQVLGQVITDEIWETMTREGFSEKILAEKEVKPGTEPRIRVRKKDVLAYLITTDLKIVPTRIRQDYVYPPIYYLTASILIEDKIIATCTNDILDEKLQDSLEATLVRQDRLTRAQLNKAAPSFNDILYFNNFTPAVFSSLKTNVARWGLSATSMILSYDIWNDIITDGDFVDWWDPVTRHELILTGKLGSILDIELITDGYRYPELKVLEPGEIYCLAAPGSLGAFCNVQEMKSNPIHKYNDSEPARGWFLAAIRAQAIVNGRALARGIRL